MYLVMMLVLSQSEESGYRHMCGSSTHKRSLVNSEQHWTGKLKKEGGIDPPGTSQVVDVEVGVVDVTEAKRTVRNLLGPSI